MPNIVKPVELNSIWADRGTKINPGESKIGVGWVVQLPPYEYQNWIDNKQDRAIAHINQHGIPEWDSITEYQGLLSYTQGSDGLIYKCLQTNTNKSPSDPLNTQYWVVAFESYGSVAIVQSMLTNHITNYQTLSGIGNLPAARFNLSVYSRLESDSRFAGLNGSPIQTFSVGVATAPDHAIRLGQVSSLLTQATESTAGVVRLATTGLTEAGVDDLTAITPLKGNNVYLKKSGNLTGLTNTVTARNNLGLGSAATQSSASFLQSANNLSDLQSVVAARSNLGLTTTATQPESYFLRAGQNLSDLLSISAARNNLGLTTAATTPLASFALKSENLSGLGNLTLARNNLGLGSAATSASTDFLARLNNLSDITNPQAARNNLQLGNISTRGVIGVSGDLDYSAGLSANGYQRLPSGLILQWGTVNGGTGSGLYNTVVNFPMAFTVGCFFVGGSAGDPSYQESNEWIVHTWVLSNSQFNLQINPVAGTPGVRAAKWFAIGV